jgi:hypothetical protein
VTPSDAPAREKSRLRGEGHSRAYTKWERLKFPCLGFCVVNPEVGKMLCSFYKKQNKKTPAWWPVLSHTSSFSKHLWNTYGPSHQGQWLRWLGSLSSWRQSSGRGTLHSALHHFQNYRFSQVKVCSVVTSGHLQCHAAIITIPAHSSTLKVALSPWAVTLFPPQSSAPTSPLPVNRSLLFWLFPSNRVTHYGSFCVCLSHWAPCPSMP